MVQGLGFRAGSIYTTIMELGPKRPSPLWFLGPNPIIVVYKDPLGCLLGGSRVMGLSSFRASGLGLGSYTGS